MIDQQCLGSLIVPLLQRRVDGTRQRLLVVRLGLQQMIIDGRGSVRHGTAAVEPTQRQQQLRVVRRCLQRRLQDVVGLGIALLQAKLVRLGNGHAAGGTAHHRSLLRGRSRSIQPRQQRAGLFEMARPGQHQRMVQICRGGFRDVILGQAAPYHFQRHARLAGIRQRQRHATQGVRRRRRIAIPLVQSLARLRITGSDTLLHLRQLALERHLLLKIRHRLRRLAPGRYSPQQRIGIVPALLLGGQHRPRVQRFRRRFVAQQLGHHETGLIRLAFGLVQPRQIEPDPRLLRCHLNRLTEQLMCPIVVACGHELIGLLA